MLLENNDVMVGRAAESLPSWLPAPGESAGLFEGAAHGSDVSFCVVDAAPDEGPALHRHSYTETFVVQGGRGRFELDGRTVEAVAGEVVVVPPETVHAFRAVGPERLRLVAIHASARVESHWVRDEAPAA